MASFGIAVYLIYSKIRFFRLDKSYHILFILYRSSHFQQTLNNFVNFNFFFTKLSEIDPCEKCIDMLGGHAWRHIFMACSKLEAMDIYIVKQPCGNDIMPSVYSRNCFKDVFRHFTNDCIVAFFKHPLFSGIFLIISFW